MIGIKKMFVFDMFLTKVKIILSKYMIFYNRDIEQLLSSGKDWSYTQTNHCYPHKLILFYCSQHTHTAKASLTPMPSFLVRQQNEKKKKSIGTKVLQKCGDFL